MGGSPRRSPEGVFWSKSSKMTRNSPTNASKGYSGPPETIPMVSDHSHFRQIFGRFEPGSLSTFSKIRPHKIENPPSPGGPFHSTLRLHLLHLERRYMAVLRELRSLV